MARPTKLTQKILDKANQYLLETKPDGELDGDLPTVPGLSIYIDIARSTIYEWAKLDTPLGIEFSDTLEKIDAFQEYRLIGKSLKGEYNSAISKLLLANHGYADHSRIDEKSEQSITVITRKNTEVKAPTPVIKRTPAKKKPTRKPKASVQPRH